MRLRPSIGREPTVEEGGNTLFDAVDDDGRVVATGTLEVELIPGAQRHGSLQFVTPDAEQQGAGDFDILTRARAGASA